MKPGHIRVFDGLRITTEHMEHLQNSFHSALQDLRQIIGLGVVHTGFEVRPDGENGILVMPGIAFDLQKNRIVSDEPKKQPITLDAENVSQFVCLQYSQVEDRLIEGKPTLIWDSCSVLMLPNLPGPDQNLIPIARLDLDEQGKLRITRLPELSQEEQAGEEPQESLTEPTEGAAIVEAPPSEATTENAGNPEPTADGPVLPMEEIQPEEKTSAAEMPSATPSSAGNAKHLVVRQGIIRPEDGMAGKSHLAGSLLEPLRQILSRSNGVVGSDPKAKLFIPLINKELSFEFPVASLSIQAVLNNTVEISQPAMEGTVAEDQTLRSTSTFEVVAQGEATPYIEANTTQTRGPVLQSGLTRIISKPETGAAGNVRLTDAWILEFPFQAVLQTVTEDRLRTDWDRLRCIYLVMSVKYAEGQNLKLSLDLAWEGGVDEESVKWLETHPTQVSWEAHIAWKAMSETCPPDFSG